MAGLKCPLLAGFGRWPPTVDDGGAQNMIESRNSVT
jgi:hypothetical protein